MNKHGGKRDKKKKPKPSEQRISTVDAIHNLYNLTAVIMCNLCEKKDTCVNRTVCTLYSDKPPQCPVCNEVMDKYGNTFVCTQCALNEEKKKRMEELD